VSAHKKVTPKYKSSYQTQSSC